MRIGWLALLVLAANVAAPGMAQQTYWQCAAFARQFSGIEIRGDAWTWWSLAEGRYERGYRPRMGSVIAFTPSARMRLGHVATVTQIVGRREIAITHANWSPIGGTRGQVERDVRVVDTSPANDWTSVRVWYAPLGDLGTTSWPVTGFIYPTRAVKLPPVVFAAATAKAPKLAYARLDTMVVDGEPGRLRLGADVMRLAQLESLPRRP